MTATLPDVEWRAVDLCAGPGGWDVAAHRLGIDALGFEIDDAAILTRDAAGHATAIVSCDDPNHPCPDLGSKTHAKTHPRRVRGLSMTEVDPRDYFPAGTRRGLIASPPCQGFSMAGKGQARADSERLLKELETVRTASDVARIIADADQWMSHVGTALVLEPLRWALRAAPSWCAWEQVPAVQPIWDACATILRRVGYTVATAVVQAEQYGVPQTRKRAVLVARSPWLTAELGPVALPAPTHSRYHSRTPDRIDPGLPRWVSMAEALGWGMDPRPSMTVTGVGGETGGAEPFGSQARERMYAEAEAGRWALATGTRPGAAVRVEDEPSATLAFGHDAGSYVWAPEGMSPAEVVEWKARHAALDARVNNQSGTAYDVEQQVETPASVLATRDLVTFRGPNANRFNGSTKSRNDGIRVTPQEAAVLQSFPADYPFDGIALAPHVAACATIKHDQALPNELVGDLLERGVRLLVLGLTGEDDQVVESVVRLDTVDVVNDLARLRPGDYAVLRDQRPAGEDVAAADTGRFRLGSTLVRVERVTRESPLLPVPSAPSARDDVAFTVLARCLGRLGPEAGPVSDALVVHEAQAFGAVGPVAIVNVAESHGPTRYRIVGSTKTKVFQQIGNAIPPLLAEALLCEVVGRPFRGARPVG